MQFMYADILIQHGFARKQDLLTYSVPDSLNIHVGSGVLVPFQKSQKAGLVLRLHNEMPTFKTKAIVSILETESLLYPWQISLAEWISEHYFCSRYDAAKLMLPKNIFREAKRTRTSKKASEPVDNEVKHILTPDQEKIVEAIERSDQKISLIHGITGAGKTEIYKSLIKNSVQAGAQCLLLAPEIALTPQLLHYFQAAFPSTAVIHSKISEGKRAEIWKGVQDGRIQLIIGSRSALFSPFKNLGLIVMDEEHEWSYKQDQNPRYHARDLVFKISELTGCKVVFGSATPSFETYHQAKEGRIALYTLSERISGTPLPKVTRIDMREELKARNYTMFSDVLEQKMRSALANKEQIILFLNRRGSASSVVCRDCGYTHSCPECELPLTYHARTMRSASLICHHCGLIKTVEPQCPSCHGSRVKYLGLGTEKVETELRKMFPTARIERADRDTMTKRDSFKDLHRKLNKQEIDILIGTQMIGKGFDIANVTLVGVILADLGLHVPDFRTPERIFQLLTQVAGRAGRRKKQGEVVIQSYNPDHPSIFFSQNHDYTGFYEQEIRTRKEAGLPPFGHIVKLMFNDVKQELCQKKALDLQKQLTQPGYEVYAAPALIPRVKKQYQWNVLIQGPDPVSLLKKIPQEELATWKIDVDPQITV